MAAKPKASQPSTPKVAKIYKATLGSLGRVVRGVEVTEAEAVAERQAERDIVVCGSDRVTNRRLAMRIEAQVGPYKDAPPHKYLGPYALPHFQPDPRNREGHSFYETDKRKAARNP